MKSLISLLLIFSTLAQADLSVCPRMPVTAGSAGQFVSAISASGAVTLGTPTLSSTKPTIQRFTSTGTTTGYLFTISTSSTVAVNDTYTNNGNTYTVLGALTAQSGQVLYTSQAAAPQASGTLTRSAGSGTSSITFTSALATASYTTPASVLYIRVKAVGGGGGGGGSNSSGGAGGAGVLSAFGPNLITAGGGSGGGGGASNSTGGSGGTATVNASGTVVTINALSGGGGGPGLSEASYAAGYVVYPAGGIGGASYFGGAGASSSIGNVGGAGAANTGGGGAGGGLSSSANAGAGGGSGAFAEAQVAPTAAQVFTYVVGTGGSAGAGAGGIAGGAGGTGQITVEEYYQ